MTYDFDTMMQEHYDELEAGYVADVDGPWELEEELDEQQRRVNAMIAEELRQSETAFGHFCQGLAAQWEGNDQDCFDRLYQGLLSGTISAENAKVTGQHIATCRYLLTVIDLLACWRVMSDYRHVDPNVQDRREAMENEYQYFLDLGCFLPRGNYYRECYRKWRLELVPNRHFDDADLPRDAGSPGLALSDHDWKRIGF